jgi:hypothetical protein
MYWKAQPNRNTTLAFAWRAWRKPWKPCYDSQNPTEHLQNSSRHLAKEARNTMKTSVRIPGLLTEKTTGDFPNTKQKCQPLSRDAGCCFHYSCDTQHEQQNTLGEQSYCECCYRTTLRIREDSTLQSPLWDPQLQLSLITSSPADVTTTEANFAAHIASRDNLPPPHVSNSLLAILERPSE